MIDTAVDIEYFHANGSPPRDDRVVFVGSMDWLPNQDAMEYFYQVQVDETSRIGGT